MLVIAGLLFSAYNPTKAGRTLDKVDSTKAKLRVIDDALKAYKITSGGKYPCPASRIAPAASDWYGAEAENCPNATVTCPAGLSCPSSDSNLALIGTIPTRALDLSDSYMYDEWGSRIIYAINFGRVHTGSAKDPIILQTIDGTAINPAPDYVIGSHGPNRIGAYNRVGIQEKYCTGGTDDVENCDDDITFIDDKWSVTGATVLGSTRSFDDMVLNDVVAKVPCPLEIPGCVLWLDATDINADGVDYTEDSTESEITNVTTWYDKSGQGRDAVAGNAPVRQTGSFEFLDDEGNLVSRPTVFFNGTKSLSTAAASWGNKFTLMAVILPSTNVTSNIFRTDGNHINFGYTRNGAGRQQISAQFRGCPETCGTNYRSGLPGRKVLVTGHSGGVGTKSGIRINGQQHIEGIHGTSAMSTSPFSFVIGGNSAGFNGEVAELVYYPTNLPDNQIKQLECYMSEKYGMKLDHCTNYCVGEVTTPACPGDVDDCQIWYSANDASLLKSYSGMPVSDGDTIEFWCDKSGHNNNAISYGSPSFKANGFSTGFDSVHTADVINANKGGFILPKTDIDNGFTTFFVAKFAYDYSNQEIISMWNSANMLTPYHNVYRMWQYSFHSGTTGYFGQNSAFVGTEYILALKHDPIAEIATLYVNGEMVSEIEAREVYYHPSASAYLEAVRKVS